MARVKSEQSVPAEKAEAMLSVRLLKNYRPINAFKVMELSDPEDPESPLIEREPAGRPEEDGRRATDEWAKVWADMTIKLPRSEAESLVKRRLAEVDIRALG